MVSKERDVRVKLSIWLVIILLLMTLGLTACGKAKKSEANGPEAKKAIAIKALPVQLMTVQRTVEGTGSLAGWDEVVVSTEVKGQVVGILADMGDLVKKGQILIKLDPREAQSALEQAEGNYRQSSARHEDAQVRFKRMQDLLKQGAVSQQDFDGANMQIQVYAAEYYSAKAALDLAKKKMGDTIIRAPIEGAVKERLVNLGEFMDEKKPVMALATTSPLKLKITIPERFSGEIRAGQEVQIKVEAFPDKVFKGKVTRISPAVFEDSRTFALEASVPNPGGLLKPGFFAKAEVLTRIDSEVPMVPQEAMVSIAGVNKIYLIRDHKAKELLITMGQKKDGLVEIIDSLKPTDLVAVTGLAQLSDGALVELNK
jgi:membrane fusion protein (multidrug efflux system)/multidrug efflux system membrane fusion protein/cobalt-zinc-cadmium efflux system membrane fusion protein